MTTILSPIIVTKEGLLGRCSSCGHNGVGSLTPLCDVKGWRKQPGTSCRYHENKYHLEGMA